MQFVDKAGSKPVAFDVNAVNAQLNGLVLDDKSTAMSIAAKLMPLSASLRLTAGRFEPGKLNFSSAGPGTTPHIGAELLKQEAGIDIVHVPYRGAAPAVTALLAGEVQLAVVDLLPVLPHVAAGKLRIVAVAGTARAPQAPDAPTTKEMGLPGVLMDTHYGVIGPVGLPADVQKKFRDAIVAAVQSPEIRDELLKQGAIAITSTPQDYRALMQAEFDKWRTVITKGKITLE